MILGFVWDSQVLDIAKKVKSIVDLSGSIRRLLWHGSELVLVLADWSHDACGRHISWQTTHANAKLSGGTGGPWKTCGGMRAAACARGYAVLASGKSMYLVAFEPRYYPMKFRCVMHCMWQQVCSVSVVIYSFCSIFAWTVITIKRSILRKRKIEEQCPLPSNAWPHS